MIFVVVIIGSTHKAAPGGFAGLAIGITLVAIHLLFRTKASEAD